MNLLPWKNPLVVTAFLLRARRGGFFSSISIYILILAMAYGAWMYYYSLRKESLNLNPNRAYFLFLYCAQCLLSGILMLGAAGAAIKNEVLNKTLDFQRIAAVGPWEILIGKLLGQPTLSYMLAIAALPMGAFCIFNGVPGIGLLELGLLWLQMLTFLFLLGAFFIQNTMQIAGADRTSNAGGFGFVIGILVVTILSTYSFRSPQSFMLDPLRVSMAALLSPLTAVAGVQVGDPWAAKFYFFSWEIPCLIFTPLAHLAIAWFVLNIMDRRLQNGDLTPLGKRLSYLFLAVADLLIIGVLHSTGRGGPLGAAGFALKMQIGFFFYFHLSVTVLALLAVTAKRDLLWSWVWRFRGSRPGWRDALDSDRTLNTVPVFYCILTGALSLIFLCWLNGGLPADRELLELGLVFAATIFCWGLFFQWFLLVGGRYGFAIFVLVLMMAMAMPLLAGAILVSSLHEPHPLGLPLLHLTPWTLLFRWFGTSGNAGMAFKEVSPWPIAILYTLLGILAFYLIHRRLKKIIARVAQTKAEMEVTT